MIDRDRVGQLVCQPGERAGIELGFQWVSEPRKVAAHFRRFVGSRYSARHDLGEQISLEGAGVRRLASEVLRDVRTLDRKIADLGGRIEAEVEASSDDMVRHRLSLAGNRKLNYALHMA